MSRMLQGTKGSPPVAYQDYLEPGIYRSVSWVRAPPSAYLYKLVRAFSCTQIELRKARERE